MNHFDSQQIFDCQPNDEIDCSPHVFFKDMTPEDPCSVFDTQNDLLFINTADPYLLPLFMTCI